MAGTAALEFGVFRLQAVVAAEAGTQGIPVVEGHEAALVVVASALDDMAALIGAARGIGGLFQRGAVVADGAARLVMAGVAGDVAVGAVVERHREAGAFFTAQHDGIFGVLDSSLEVLSTRRGAPGQGDEECEYEKRSHAQSPSHRDNARRGG